MKRYWIVGMLCVLALPRLSHAAGQSLAEVARQEAARRQTVAKGKVFTNGDLKSVPPGSPTTETPVPGTTLTPPPPLDKPDSPPEEAAAGTVPGASTPATAAVSVDEKKLEPYWRKRVAAARDKVARAQTLQDALQARLAALATDIVNRDDPAQRSQLAIQRQKALDELARGKKELLDYQTELATTIPEEARRAGVPAGWVR